MDREEKEAWPRVLRERTLKRIRESRLRESREPYKKEFINLV